MRLLPTSSGDYSEGLASFIFKVVQEALNNLKKEAGNSFETLVPIHANTHCTIFLKTINFVKLRIAEQNIVSVAPIKSHVYQPFDIPGSKCSDTRIFIINTRLSNFAPFSA
jgi:hypothetical protein